MPELPCKPVEYINVNFKIMVKKAHLQTYYNLNYNRECILPVFCEFHTLFLFHCTTVEAFQSFLDCQDFADSKNNKKFNNFAMNYPFLGKF